MKEQTFTFKTYTYDELSQEAKEKALEELQAINVDYEWWEFSVENEARVWEEEYGIAFEPSEVCFNLELRYQELYFSANKIGISDATKLLAAISGKEEYGQMASEGLLVPSFSVQHFGGGNAVTHLRLEDYRADGSPDLPFDADEWFKDLVRGFWEKLAKEYQSLTTEESVIDTIKANELNFFEDGRRCQAFCA